jgi:hypothetical protein
MIGGDGGSSTSTGNDTLVGGGGRDTMWGEDGDDWFYAYDKTPDTLYGGDGNDRAPGYDSSDYRSSIEALTAVGLPPAGAPTGPPLTEDVIQKLLVEAVALWQAAGLSPTALETLRRITVRITDLPAGALGQADDGFIEIDPDAAGFGWFIDATPGEDSEFALGAVDSPARGHMDLLSVLCHELGHELGLDHDDGPDVMNEALAAGVRRLPEVTGETGRPVAGTPAQLEHVPAATPNVATPAGSPPQVILGIPTPAGPLPQSTRFKVGSVDRATVPARRPVDAMVQATGISLLIPLDLGRLADQTEVFQGPSLNASALDVLLEHGFPRRRRPR